MTTVVFRDGVVATDSRITLSDYVTPTEIQKLFRHPYDGVIAICGYPTAAMRLVEWLCEGGIDAGHQPDIGETSRVIHFHQNCRRITVYEEKGSYVVDTPTFMAWGSGMSVALGALHAGADAQEAVVIASRVDPHTGGKIQVMKVTQ